MRAIGKCLIIEKIKEGTTKTKGGLMLAESQREDIRYIRAKVASCSATPCTITSQSGEFSSVTRASTGNYTPNFVAGTWSQAPTCTITPGSVSSSEGVYASYLSLPTTTSFNFITNRGVTGPGNLIDTSFDIVCFGPR